VVVTDIELIRTVEVSNILGEGVLWNDRTQTAWWTDIQGARLFEYDIDSGRLTRRDMPHRVACFGFVEGGADLIVAFDCGIALYSLRTGAVEWRVAPGTLPEGLRFNDGKVDAQGRFWVGTMVERASATAGAAALYCYESGHGLSSHLEGITISNGLCWSPDARVLYHADSPTNAIRAHGFDPGRGVITGCREFAVTPGHIHPDGSTVDAAGGVWNAQWGGSRVVRYTAQGELDVIIGMPVSQPSCVAFGGPDLDLLLVTSARIGLTPEQLAAEPGAGHMFVYRTNFRGMPASSFKP
jgi:sugar lactone lactonase YvrE